MRMSPLMLSGLIALISFTACTGAAPDTDPATDTDTDTDTDVDVDCAQPEELGEVEGTALATGSTCGQNDDLTASCGTSEDMTFHWIAPYAGTFTFDPGTAYDAAVAISETCPTPTELTCSSGAATQYATSGDELRITIDGTDCGDFSLDISGTRDDELTDASGVVRDMSGTPVVGAQVRFCADVCLNAETDANGAWSVRNAERVNTSLEVLKNGEGYAVSYAAIELPVGSAPSFDITMVPLGAESTLNAAPEWHDLGGGLRVELGLPALVIPTFFPEATSVAGVSVPQASWPPLDGLTDVVAVWFSSPFDYPISGGAAVEIDNSWNLADGSVYRLYVGDYTTRAWIDSGTLTASPTLLTGAASIGHFSTIVLVGPITP